MKIKMLKSSYGADDGVNTRLFEAGKEYVLPDTTRGKELAAVFLREKWATEVVTAQATAPKLAPQTPPAAGGKPDEAATASSATLGDKKPKDKK